MISIDKGYAIIILKIIKHTTCCILPGASADRTSVAPTPSVLTEWIFHSKRDGCWFVGFLNSDAMRGNGSLLVFAAEGDSGGDSEEDRKGILGSKFPYVFLPPFVAPVGIGRRQGLVRCIILHEPRRQRILAKCTIAWDK